MTYTTIELSKILGVEPVGSNTRLISVLLIDSRSLTFADDSMFFAITTATNDGHRYVRELYEKGTNLLCY